MLADLSNFLKDFEITSPWHLLGLAGTLMFSMRFIVQWIVSERRKESVIPIAFWYLSIFGSLLSLVYAFARREPVFILQFMFNSFIYVRNLMLIHGRRRRELVGG